MPLAITKLYRPVLRPNMVRRPRLVERLTTGLQRRLTLISAPAGFGKTTLVSEWLAAGALPCAWLSLDEGDSDPARFLAYVVAALQTIAPQVGGGVLQALGSPQPPPPEVLLTTLVNDLATIPQPFILVFDDYHVVDAKPVDAALAFLLERMPPPMHLVITTREDPSLPLARLRARDQLTELRVADLRFTPAEAAQFLNQVMGLNLTEDHIAALEARTEGWITGLQLAAISMQNVPDVNGFIHSFTGSHHFVLDYLLEEVLHQQPADLQTFLLHTSLLNRLCGPLCEAVVPASTQSGQATLEYLERANLFIVPLDNERRWYRYHHLFADLLRQRLEQRQSREQIAADHLRASSWYEANGLELEAFHHATAANDLERAERLIEGKGMPLHFRGALMPVLHWLKSLPAAALDTRPALWVTYASVLSMTGQLAEVEPKLKAAEAALSGAEPNAHTRNLIGHIAALRALLAASQYQVDAIITYSQRALDYLHPNNLSVRTATIWKLGMAYQMQGNRAAALQAYGEAMAISQTTGNIIIHVSAATGLGYVQEIENQLHQAAETYRRTLQLAEERGLSAALGEAKLGLARITYEWNDLAAAQTYAEQCAQLLTHQLQNTDRTILCDLVLARLQLARADAAGALTRLTQTEQVAQRAFPQHLPAVVAVQVLALLQQKKLDVAAQVAEAHPLPLSQARVWLARGEAAKALAVLDTARQQAEAKGWVDERLRVLTLQTVAYLAQGQKGAASKLLREALALAEPGGFVRLFVDEGPPMLTLLTHISAEGGKSMDYVQKLSAAFGTLATSGTPPLQPLADPLSEREMNVLRLIAQGLSNQAISQQLFLALSTVKGHNQRIFDKLHVQNRTEAIARARELGLL